MFCLFTVTSVETTTNIPKQVATTESMSTTQIPETTTILATTTSITTTATITTTTTTTTATTHGIDTTSTATEHVTYDNNTMYNKTSYCQCICVDIQDGEVECLFDDVDCITTALRKKLIIQVSSLSSYKNKKISAYDGRVSSKTIGYSGCLVLFIVGCFIVIPDIMQLCRHIFNYIKQRHLYEKFGFV